MKSPDTSPVQPSLKPAIVFLSWMTACYVVSFIGYEGATQGLWFWYVALDQPTWRPPDWTFTPSWTILYGLMGLAAWQIGKEPSSPRKTWGLVLFFAQLALNGFWPWLFFSMHRAGPTIWVLTLLMLLVIATTVLFWRIKPVAGKLLIPVVVAIAFTGLLIFFIWRMNS